MHDVVGATAAPAAQPAGLTLRLAAWGRIALRTAFPFLVLGLLWELTARLGFF
jgi:hypothetical protein